MSIYFSSLDYLWIDLLCTEANNNIEKVSLKEERRPKLIHMICDIDGELIEGVEVVMFYWILNRVLAYNSGKLVRYFCGL